MDYMDQDDINNLIGGDGKSIQHSRNISQSTESDITMDECIICFNRLKPNENLYTFQCCSKEIHLQCYLNWLKNNLDRDRIGDITCIFCRSNCQNTKELEVILDIGNQNLPIIRRQPNMIQSTLGVVMIQYIQIE